jgi:hypothetical protein
MLAKYKSHIGSVNSVDFHQNDTFIASGSSDGYI